MHMARVEVLYGGDVGELGFLLEEVEILMAGIDLATDGSDKLDVRACCCNTLRKMIQVPTFTSLDAQEKSMLYCGQVTSVI